jgi:hypothetical protein
MTPAMHSPRTRHRASRRGIVALGFDLLLGSLGLTSSAATGMSICYQWRAAKEVPRAEAALREAGYTLDVTALATPEVPDEENAGAIGPLLGLATREADETPEIKERRIRLSLLSFKLPQDLPDGAVREAAAKLLAGGKVDLNAIKDVPKRRYPPEIFSDKPINWTEWVQWFQLLGWPTPATEVTDAGVVYKTLAQQTDFLTAPLREAAGRKHAQMTPSQSSRFKASLDRKDVMLELDLRGSRFIPALRAISLQMEAALASGRDKEAADLVPLLFRLRDIVTSDDFLIDFLVRQTADSVVIDALHRNLRKGTATALYLEAMQSALSSKSSLEGLDRVWILEAAFGCHMMQQMIEQRVSLNDITLFGSLNEQRGKRRWYEEPLAGSVLELNRAARIRFFLEDMGAWKQGGPLGYYRAAEARQEHMADREGWTAIFRLDQLIAEGAVSGFSNLIPRFIFRDMRQRMALVACALERHRLAGGDVPEKLDALPRNLLPEIPADLDCQPIRYCGHDDGWVLWSVGMDLKDDVRGAAPAPDKMEDQQRADWQWRNRSSEWK